MLTRTRALITGAAAAAIAVTAAPSPAHEQRPPLAGWPLQMRRAKCPSGAAKAATRLPACSLLAPALVSCLYLEIADRAQVLTLAGSARPGRFDRADCARWRR